MSCWHCAVAHLRGNTEHTGVGASECIRCAKDFRPSFTRLVRNVVVRFLPATFLPQSSWRPFVWCDLQVKVFSCFSSNVGRHFVKSNNVGRHFDQIFRDFAQIFRDFAKFFRDFVRIFDKSILLELRFHPLHPRLLHHWCSRLAVTQTAWCWTAVSFLGSRWNAVVTTKRFQHFCWKHDWIVRLRKTESKLRMRPLLNFKKKKHQIDRSCRKMEMQTKVKKQVRFFLHSSTSFKKAVICW